MPSNSFILRSNTNSAAAWNYEEVQSPQQLKHNVSFEEVMADSGVTDEMIFQSQLNDALTTQRIYSLVFTKENIHKLGFRNLIKQMRTKIGKVAALPTCEIRLTNVDYIATLPIENSNIKTVTPTLPKLQSKNEKTHNKHILHNINAIFKPGTMTLVLGPPGCGKTTLLKLIAGLIKPKSHEILNGSITYNGCHANQVDLASLTTYVQQQDNHITTLTVQETFEFAHKCLVGQIAPDDPLAINEEHMVDILISVFGLEECADTMIGDDMIRGVSGGQRRRVTVGEMLTGRASALLIDEFSNGLDASTTFDIAKAIGTMAELLEKTVVMSMLQPPPEVYDLFDNVIVMDKGEMVYCGPRTELVPYFRSIGYHCPPRKDIADFLQEVTTTFGARYINNRSSRVLHPPKSPLEFAAAFTSCPLGHQLATDLAVSRNISFLGSTSQKRVALGYLESFKVVFGRAVKTSLRDKKFNKSRMANALVLGVILGTVFMGIATKAANPMEETHYAPMKVGLLFAAILFQALATLNSIQAGIERRNVLYKQLSFKFFPVSTYVLSEFILEVFWTLPQALLFTLPLYYGASLNPNVGHYFICMLTMYLVSMSYSQLYKLLTAISPDGVLAKVIALFTIFMHVMFSGYVMPQEQLPRGWLWLYWCNPMTWALRIVAQNEYLSSRPIYDIVLPGRGRIGDIALSALGFSTDSVFIPTGFIFLVAYCIVLCMTTGAAYLRIRHRPTFIHKEENTTEATEVATAIAVKSRSDINSLHFEPVTLAFRDLYYTIPIGPKKNKETRQLLKGIHGCFEPGTLTALMGSSGAGKTTLMDVIAGRKTAGTIDGELFVNGHVMDRKTFTNLMGYCEQFDTYEETSTVRETFLFCAALRMPRGTSVAQQEAFVFDIMTILELETKANDQFGSLTQGERKRVTIGGELLSNPSILFLDEPTTGLDSRAATIVMECVKRIAQSGRTVVCTIHQPSTVLFELFDKLLLLKSGGEMVYYGPLGIESCEMLEYFQQSDGVEPMKLNENPATYMLNCIGAGTSGSKNEVDFTTEYEKSWLRKDNLKLVGEWAVPHGNVLEQTEQYSASFWGQVQALMKRQLTIYWRSPSYNRSRLIIAVVLALVFASMYAGQSITTILDVLSRMVLLNISSCFMCISMLSAAIPFTMRNRGVYYRERMSNMYSPTAYMVVVFLVELIYICAFAAVYVHGLYWSIGLNTATTAWTWYWLILTVSMAMWSVMGQLLSFAVSTHQVAVLLGGAIPGIWFVFGGYFIDGNTLVKGWQWMYWACPFHYMLEAIIMTQFNGDDRVVLNVLDGTHVQIQKFVENYFNGAYTFDNRYTDLFALIVITIIVEALILLCMSKVCHLKR
ncbi:ATP-binding Cassette (ABC) Superfamily [Thraustotheca clavata]|uniref:ATP-binding Cassette (ABC) Superfamily n=1 Tax=Thraustotheca clavata TaxID=74557 RepID=A0A1W0ACK7_9STRA|nr:ATP-binding Cassette (ABC) Superfamily [Thraustotheca clavata]